MNNFGSYQKLGPKTLIVFALENAGPTLTIGSVWIILVALRMFWTESLGSMFPNSAEAPAAIANILNVCLWVGAILLALAAAFAVLLAVIDYFTYFFMLDENGVHIKQGLLTKTEVSIPYRRIQNVNIEQNPIHQMVGAARLTIITTGENEEKDHDRDEHDAEITLPPIDKVHAEEIREILVRKTNVEKFLAVGPNGTAISTEPVAISKV